MAFSTHDIVPDSPTNNFCTLNLLDEAGGLLFSEGNLKISANTGWDGSRANFSYPLTGKWYWETFCAARSTGVTVGILSTSAVIVGDLAASSNGYVYNSGDGSKYNNGSASSYGNTWGQNNIIGVLWDSDTATLTFYKDGISQGTAWSGLTGEFSPAINVNGSDSMIANFGQDPSFGGASNLPTGAGDYDTDAAGNSTGGRFAYQPPTDALALCTANLPDFTPTVTDDTPQDYFEAVTYTGNGTGQSITGIGFQPDLVWVKKRSASGNHFLVDSVSGANKELNSNNTAAQVNNTGGIQSLNPTSFTVGIDGGVNGSSETYVAWCWKAGGAPTADNSNTSGAMTANSVSLNGTLQSNYTPAGSPTVYPKRMSINTDAGFSIVKYTGTGSSADLPHGLNKAPEFILIKNIEVANSWAVYHVSLGPQKQFLLNSTNGSSSDINGFDATPTTNYVNLGSGASMDTNQTGTHIMYCWHSVEGYSKFGSYVGNGSADGPFIYTGFKPSFLIIKDTTSAGGWFILDNARNQYNPVNSYLLAQSSGTEDPNNSTVDYDFVSNGIKVRATSTNLNTNNNVYIFMAFAEMPFKYANAR
jgi:hypothetical protein